MIPRRRLRHHRDHLLRQHVQRIARIARRLHVALVHGARHGGAGHQVGAVLGEDDALADRVHVMPRAPDALHAARDRGRRLDLDHQIDRAHVDAQFERRGGAQSLDLPGLQQLFDHRALRRGERSVMRARDGFAGKIVQRAGQPLGDPPAVDEDEGRIPLADELEQPRMDRVPDGQRRGACEAGRWGSLPLRPSRAMSSTGTSMRSFNCLSAVALTIVTGR